MFFATAFGLLLLSCDLGTVECARVKIKKHSLTKESLPQRASALVESKVSDQSSPAGAASISASVAAEGAASDSVDLSMQRSRAADADSTASHAPLAAAQRAAHAFYHDHSEQQHAQRAAQHASAMIALNSVVASVRAHLPSPSIHAGYLSLLVGTGLFIMCFCIGGLRLRKRRDFPNPRTTRRFSKDPAAGSARRFSKDSAEVSDDVLRCKSYEYKMSPEEEQESDEESTDVGEASDRGEVRMGLQHQYSIRSEVDGEDEDVDGQSSTTVVGQSSTISEGKTAVFHRMQSVKEEKDEEDEEEKKDDANDAKLAAVAEDSDDGLIEF